MLKSVLIKWCLFFLFLKNEQNCPWNTESSHQQLFFTHLKPQLSRKHLDTEGNLLFRFSTMFQSDTQYSKLRWLLTIGGLIIYVFDICTDIKLSLRYFQQMQYIWGGLTALFVLMGLMVTQIFSYAWYRDDISDVFQNHDGTTTISGVSKGGLAAMHLLGLGVFFR